MTTAIAVLLMVVGVGLVAVGVARVGRAVASERWDRVPGTIVRSEVTAHGVGADRVHRLEFSYEYAVGDRTHRSSRVGFTPLWRRDPPERTARLVQRYPAGSPVGVYVDPRDPDRSVLEPGAAAGMLLVPVTGVVLVLVGAVLVL